MAIQSEMAAASPGHVGPLPPSALQRARSPSVLQTPQPLPLPVIKGMEEPVRALSGCRLYWSLPISSST